MANLVSVIRARLVHFERAVVQLNLVSADLKYTPLYRLLSNYEHREGELLSVREIVNNSQNDKENINGSITSCTIGQLIKQLWGDKVRLVKRGSRNQRQNYYLNLGKKTNNNSASTSIKSGWQLVYNQETKSSFVRLSSWSFKNQTGTMELRIEKTDEATTRYSIASHGCQIDINDRLDQDLEKHSPEERAEIIFKIIDASAFCKGVTLEKGEVLNTVIPHQSGIFKDEHSEEMRAFSDSCRIFSAEKNCCDQCQKLKSNSDQRKKRRMEFGGMVHPNTNKRYLMKDDIATQLQLERQARINAEKKQNIGEKSLEMSA